MAKQASEIDQFKFSDACCAFESLLIETLLVSLQGQFQRLQLVEKSYFGQFH